MSVAWKELETNLVASRELTKLAKEKEEAVMREWSDFHDYAGARQYSEKWYSLVFAVNELRGPLKHGKAAKPSKRLVDSARPRRRRRLRSRRSSREPG